MTAHQQVLLRALAKDEAIQALLAARVRTPLQAADLRPLDDQGLAHEHVLLGSSGLLLRLPKQSQWQQAPEDNLAYQAACFWRLATSGATPRCHAVLPVSPDLPFGGLLVDFIDGRRADAAQDMTAIAACLAQIHTSSEPTFWPGGGVSGCALAEQSQVVEANLPEIDRQMGFIDRYPLEPEARALLIALRAELSPPKGAAGQGGVLPRYPIANDTHPGNYRLVPRTPNGAPKAVLVDLEKAAFGNPGIDLAHASAYTSTTWEAQGSAELSLAQVTDFYRCYLSLLPPDMAAALMPWLLVTRRLLYLRALSWCLMWLSELENPDSGWSQARSDSALVSHFQARARHFLQAGTLEFIRQELEGLHESLCP